MKVTDFIAKFLSTQNIKTAFGLQGGAVAHIFDSLEKFNFDVTYMHHEESAALAGVAATKMSDFPALVVVTSGPGGTNAITGLLAAWQDSVPCIFISGQVRTNHVSYNKKVRQIGTQESKILDIVKPITKKIFYVKNKNSIQKIIESSIHTAISGRPGPVWIDLPLNLQWENIEKFKIYKIKKSKKNPSLKNKIKYQKFFDLYNNSTKPLFILGYGLRLSGKLESYKKIIKDKNLPFVTTWTAADYFPSSFKNNIGIIGMRGHRGANKAVFESDLLVCLGTHLSIPHTTTLTNEYAPKSKKIIINIDNNQLKNLNIKFDLKINDALENFLSILSKIKRIKQSTNLLNLKKLNWYNQKSNKINSNTFIRNLTSKAKPGTNIIIDGGGTALYSGFQSSVLKNNSRIICSSAISAMGTGLAETIGSFKSSKAKKYICIIGDGSFLMNIQDLQTIKSLNIPVIIVVVNNNGYLAIRQTQGGFLKNKFYGTHPKWSLDIAKISKLADSFEIKYIKANKHKINEQINNLLEFKKPIICELVTDEDQGELFRQDYSLDKNKKFKPAPLNEMWPYLNSDDL